MASYTRTILPEQKTTPVLAPFRTTTELLAARKATSDSPRALRPETTGLALPISVLKLLSCQSTAGETTRGPPLMDPPRSC
jgi:hypothetical protein